MDGQLILRKARGLLYQFRQLPKIPCTLSNLCRRCGPGMWDSGHHPAIECVGHTDDDHCILSDEWIQISIVSKCITIRWNSAFEYLYKQKKTKNKKTIIKKAVVWFAFWFYMLSILQSDSILFFDLQSFTAEKKNYQNGKNSFQLDNFDNRSVELGVSIKQRIFFNPKNSQVLMVSLLCKTKY